MSHPTLADFLESLAAAGELLRVEAEVDPELEIAEVTDRAVKQSGPTLLFERVRGCQGVVVTNLFATERRILMALGCDSLGLFVERLETLPEAIGKAGWLERLSSRSAEAGLERFAPKTVKVGACQQVVQLASDVDLGTLPLLRSWPGESTRSITAALLLTADPETGRQTAARELLAVVDRNRLAVIWDAHSPGYADLAGAKARGEKLPVAVVLGGSPTLMLLPDMPLAPGADLLALVGLLGDGPLPVVRGRTQAVEVPAEAEMVIEGTIDPARQAECSPVAAPTGFYHQGAACHVIEVTAVTQRANAATPARVFGRPPSELTAIDRLAERMLLPLARSVAPEVVDLALPPASGRQNLVFVSIQKQYPGQVRKVAGALWGLPALMRTKTLIVVDAHVDVHQAGEVFFRVGVNVFPQRDVFTQDGPADLFDHALGSRRLGCRLGVDATAKLPGEHDGPWPDELAASAETRAQVESRWSEYGLGREAGT